jgi:hypothetical protein
MDAGWVRLLPTLPLLKLMLVGATVRSPGFVKFFGGGADGPGTALREPPPHPVIVVITNKIASL